MSNLFNEFINKQQKLNHDYSILKIAVNKNNKELANIYKNYSDSHNNSLLNNIYFNSGFDLFFPETVKIDGNFKTTMVSMDVKCEMVDSNESPIAFCMYPRSSISKTPLMLANHVGIIDSGYRGNLIGAFRCMDTNTYTVEKHSRLLQVTNSKLLPIFVKMVDENDLSTTERGSGGFGSTGI
jgi:dUTP pyrophosphatase